MSETFSQGWIVCTAQPGAGPPLPARAADQPRERSIRIGSCRRAHRRCRRTAPLPVERTQAAPATGLIQPQDGPLGLPTIADTPIPGASEIDHVEHDPSATTWGRRVRMAWLAAACVAPRRRPAPAPGARWAPAIARAAMAGSPGAQPGAGAATPPCRLHRRVLGPWLHTTRTCPPASAGGANPGRMYTCQADAPPVNLGNWRSVGTGDCPGRMSAAPAGRSPIRPDATPGSGSFTAVCWGQNCTYKEPATGQCTGGANPGRMYTCQASATSSGTGSPGAGSNRWPHRRLVVAPRRHQPPRLRHAHAVVSHVGDTRTRTTSSSIGRGAGSPS